MTYGPPGRRLPDPSGDLWGFLCRVNGGEVSFERPAAFRPAAASTRVQPYLARMATELARRPERYGYDPDARYSVYVQTQDRAMEPFASLAFGRCRSGQEAVGLIPDVYFIESDGYAEWQLYGLRTPRWSARSRDVVWRGSITGVGEFAGPLDIPRVRLAHLCRDRPGLNVGLIGVHETMRFEPRAQLEAFVREERLLAGRWPIHDLAYHRFVIDIDGHANAWGLLEKLILGCCVLKVESPYEQWFYPRLRAFEHCVPVAADLSDLHQAIAWCRDNEDECEWIAANGVRLARSLRLQAVVEESCATFMRVAVAERA